MEIIHLDGIDFKNDGFLFADPSHEGNLFLYHNKVYKIFKRTTVTDYANKEAKLRILRALQPISGLILPEALLYLHGNFVGYVMPYIKSKPLSSYTFHKKSIKLELLHKAKEVVTRAHEAGIILGDLHLSNFLVDEKGDVHACDLDSCTIGPYLTNCFVDFQALYLQYHPLDIHLDYFSFNICTIALLKKYLESMVIREVSHNRLFSRQVEPEVYDQFVHFQKEYKGVYLIDHLKNKSVKKRVLSLMK